MIFRLFIRIYVGCLDFIIKIFINSIKYTRRTTDFINVSCNNFIRFSQITKNIIGFAYKYVFDIEEHIIILTYTNYSIFYVPCFSNVIYLIFLF